MLVTCYGTGAVKKLVPGAHKPAAAGMALLLVLALAAAAASGGEPPPPPPHSLPLTSRTVRTKYGDVSGVIVSLDSRHLEPVEVFRGIPYASPPVGSLRFMPPVTGALWSGVKMADKFGPVCPQRLPDISNETAALKRIPRGRLEHLRRLLPYLSEQSEDCLYLNIYAPVQGRYLGQQATFSTTIKPRQNGPNYTVLITN